MILNEIEEYMNYCPLEPALILEVYLGFSFARRVRYAYALRTGGDSD